jgi:hypothetical protein
MKINKLYALCCVIFLVACQSHSGMYNTAFYPGMATMSDVKGDCPRA